MGFCFVPNCYSEWTDGRKTPEILFHRFPEDKTFRRIWKIKIRSVEKPTSSSRVCSLHFCYADYVLETTRLRDNAIPTRHLPSMSYELSVKRALTKVKKLLELQRNETATVRSETTEKDDLNPVNIEGITTRSFRTYRRRQKRHNKLDDDPDFVVRSEKRVCKKEIPKPFDLPVPTGQKGIQTKNRAARKCCVPVCSKESSTKHQISWFGFPDNPRWRRLWYDAIFAGHLALKASNGKSSEEHAFTMTCRMIQPSGSEVTIRCWALRQPPALYQTCFENDLMRQLRERLRVHILNHEELSDEGVDMKKDDSLVCSAHFLDGRPTAQNPIPQINLGLEEDKVIQFSLTSTHEDHTYADADIEIHVATRRKPAKSKSPPPRVASQPSPVQTLGGEQQASSPPTVSVARLRLSPTLVETVDPLTTDIDDPLTTDIDDPLMSDIDDPLTTDTDDPLTTDISDPLTTDVGDPLTTDIDDPLTTDIGDPLTTDIGYPLTTDIGDPLTTDIGDPLTTDIGDPLTTDIGDLLTTDIGDLLTTDIDDQSYPVHDHNYADATVKASDSTLWGQYNVSPLAEACYSTSVPTTYADRVPAAHDTGISSTSYARSVPKHYGRSAPTSYTTGKPAHYTGSLDARDTGDTCTSYTKSVLKRYLSNAPTYKTRVPAHSTSCPPGMESIFTEDQELFYASVKQEVEDVDVRREPPERDRHLSPDWRQPTAAGYNIKTEVFRPDEVADALDEDECDPLAFETPPVKQEPIEAEPDPCGSFQFVDVSNLLVDYHPNFDDLDGLDSPFLPA